MIFSFQIMIGPYEQHIVRSESEDRAVKKWLEDQGWESAEAAAAEYEGVTSGDVHAVLLGR